MNVTQVNINGTLYYIKDTISGYTSFEADNLLSSGTEVGTMTFNGITYTLYAPDQEEENPLNIAVRDTNLIFSDDEIPLERIVIADTQEIIIPNYEYDDGPDQEDYGIINIIETQEFQTACNTQANALEFWRNVSKVITTIDGIEDEFIPTNWDDTLLVPEVYWHTHIMDFYSYTSFDSPGIISNDSWDISSAGNTYTIKIEVIMK